MEKKSRKILIFFIKGIKKGCHSFLLPTFLSLFALFPLLLSRHFWQIEQSTKYKTELFGLLSICFILHFFVIFAPLLLPFFFFFLQLFKKKNSIIFVPFFFFFFWKINTHCCSKIITVNSVKTAAFFFLLPVPFLSFPFRRRSALFHFSLLWFQTELQKYCEK